MTTVLKRTILFLMAIFVLELIFLSVLVFATQRDAIAGGASEMTANDPTYMLPVDKVALEPDTEVVSEPETEIVVEPEENVVKTESVESSEIEEETDAVEETVIQSASSSDGYVDANVDRTWIAGSDFMMQGVHYDGSGYSYTYYSENVLPGGGLNIPGRHVGDEGYVCDGDGNLCLASDDLPYGTVVNVPFGSGTAVVYDCGSGYGNLDVYVSW